jgi:hypothetical protein
MNEIVNHALISIFRPIRYNFIQPIACYFYKGL